MLSDAASQVAVVPRIVFSSRTHSQLAQVIRELRKIIDVYGADSQGAAAVAGRRVVVAAAAAAAYDEARLLAARYAAPAAAAPLLRTWGSCAEAEAAALAALTADTTLSSVDDDSPALRDVHALSIALEAVGYPPEGLLISMSPATSAAYKAQADAASSAAAAAAAAASYSRSASSTQPPPAPAAPSVASGALVNVPRSTLVSLLALALGPIPGLRSTLLASRTHMCVHPGASRSEYKPVQVQSIGAVGAVSSGFEKRSFGGDGGRGQPSAKRYRTLDPHDDYEEDPAASLNIDSEEEGCGSGGGGRGKAASSSAASGFYSGGRDPSLSIIGGMGESGVRVRKVRIGLHDGTSTIEDDCQQLNDGRTPSYERCYHAKVATELASSLPATWDLEVGFV